MDKHRFNAIIRQTTLERNALEKSLDKMERENTELVLQIGRLQSQVTTLSYCWIYRYAYQRHLNVKIDIEYGPRANHLNVQKNAEIGYK